MLLYSKFHNQNDNVQVRWFASGQPFCLNSTPKNWAIIHSTELKLVKGARGSKRWLREQSDRFALVSTKESQQFFALPSEAEALYTSWSRYEWCVRWSPAVHGHY